jgi:hypothetical protein
MKDDDDLEKLKKVVRGRCTRRELVCPYCENEVTLRDHVLHCNNGHTMQTLAELKALP